MSDQTVPNSADTEAMVQAYIKMRDARSVLKKEYEEKDAGVKAQMDTIESTLLELCKAQNSTSIGTGSGTIIRGVKSYYWTNDWDSMYTWIKENNLPEMLERRISQTNMKEYLTQNPDKLPKGMNMEAKYTITIRRK